MSSQAKRALTGTIEEALSLTETALSHVTRIAIEQIRNGLGPSSHVEAAERDIRSALRQLGMAAREHRPVRSIPASGDERSETIDDTPPNAD